MSEENTTQARFKYEYENLRTEEYDKFFGKILEQIKDPELKRKIERNLL